jgi:hypothetical protein
MILQLTTFLADSIEPMDKIYSIRDKQMYSVIAIEPNDDEYYVVILDGGVSMALKGVIEPSNLLVLIKEL